MVSGSDRSTVKRGARERLARPPESLGPSHTQRRRGPRYAIQTKLKDDGFLSNSHEFTGVRTNSTESLASGELAGLAGSPALREAEPSLP